MTLKPQKLSPGEQQVKLNRGLIKAAEQGDTEAARALLAVGADVHAWNDDALRQASKNGHAETVRILLTVVDVHAVRDMALYMAGLWGHTETVKMLLAAGADVHATNDCALRHAAETGHTQIVQLLLAAGADVHADEDYALHIAARNGHSETVKILARHIFAPESWRGKNRTAIEAEANALYIKIEAGGSITPERLHEAGSILIDSALHCWEQVRPARPKLQISPLPARPRPV
jgi:hypothetical protein